MKKLNIDIIRFIVAFLVVAIHISPFEKINSNFDFFFTRILGRIAVPLFLMITGYYIIEKALKDIKYLKKYTMKVIKLYLLCIILYIPINIYMGKFSNIDIIILLKDIFIEGTLYHLWYFPALISGLWITYFLIKKLGNKTLYIVVILYAMGLLGDSYYGVTKSFNLLNIIYDYIFKIFNYTRNGLFLAPIFLYLGYIVKGSKSKKYDIYLSVLLFICMTIEGFILNSFSYQKHDSMYIFLIPFMYFIFRYLMTSNLQNKKFRLMSQVVYIIHPLFIVVVRFLSGILNLDKVFVLNNLILYITVCLMSVIFSVIVCKVKGVVEK